MKASGKKSGLRPTPTLQVRVAYESDASSSKAESDNQALIAGNHAAALAEWARVIARVVIRADRAGQLAADPRNDFAAASPESSMPDANAAGCSRRVRVRTSHRRPCRALEGAKDASRGEFQ